MMNRLGLFVGMFAVCFGGVYAALALHESLSRKSSSSLEGLIGSKPVSYGRQPGELAFADAARKLLPSIVRIDRLEASMFSRDSEPRPSGEGSGVVLTADGYIITNNHVIQGGDAISVTLATGSRYDAQLVGADPLSDLALLKVNADGLEAAELGDSDALIVGEWVLAVGNPLGYEGTLSVGVISALNRDLSSSPLGGVPLVGAIQTDAAINPGNSGGALANIHGQVVGINAQIASPSGGSIGIGFAIPMNRVKKAVAEMRKYGRVRHPDFGVARFAPPYVLQHPLFEERIGPKPPEQGLVIDQLIADSPLAKAEVMPMDVIVEINGKTVATVNDYLIFLLKAEVGEDAKVKLWHRGEYRTMTVKLTELRTR